MSRQSYRVISCEGGDQCGKADAVLTFRKKFLERGVSVTFSSFPMYASPFGTCIRKFLRNGLEDFNFDPKRELKIKMSLYALDRLQFLDVILSDPIYKQTLILLDRSSFSNAVTLAYGIVNIKDLTNDEIDKYVKYAFWLDNLMIKKLRLENCVVQMVAIDNSWSNVRNEKKDINENIDVQRMTDKSYDLFQDRVGSGWKKIVTKVDEGWTKREDIFQNIYDFVVERTGEFNLEAFPKDYTVNIQEVVSHCYSSADVSEKDVDMYWEALNENNKDVMHEYGMKVGEQIGKSCSSLVLNDKDIRKKFCMILRDLPELYTIFDRYLGENFKEVITESVFEWTKEE